MRPVTSLQAFLQTDGWQLDPERQSKQLLLFSSIPKEANMSGERGTEALGFAFKE